MVAADGAAGAVVAAGLIGVITFWAKATPPSMAVAAIDIIIRIGYSFIIAGLWSQAQIRPLTI